MTAIIAFLKDQGPALLIMVIMFFRGEIVRAGLHARIDALEAEKKDNHAKVDAEFSGQSDADVIKSVAGPDDPQPQPSSGEKPS